ncbi:MAG: caspase family protein [Campylobacterota bacterium]|nr:caspase family protein [Campylobacterota bacterium]
MQIFKIVILASLLSVSVLAENFALLVETSSGSPINTDKDIVTMKRILGSGYTYTILNQKNATSSNIRAELEKMSKLSKDDTFVFYYSGHGARFANGDSTEKDKRDDFLVTSDIKCSNNYIKGVLTDNELNYLYSKIPAKKVVFIDACHSQTMYKSLNGHTNSKLYKGCTKYTMTQGFKTDPKFLNAKVNNLLHFGAAKEKEAAEGSGGGGIFTLALEKSLKENGNIPLSTFITKVKENIKPIASIYPKANGEFIPSLDAFGVDKSRIYTKDIFAVVKPKPKENSFKDLLESKLGNLKLQIHGEKSQFTLGQAIVLKSRIPDEQSHIYLIDILDKNHYKLLDTRISDDCIALTSASQRMCQYTDFVGTAPFGKSELYMIITKKPLLFDAPTKNIVPVAIHIEQQLRKRSFEVAKVSFTVNP